MTESPMRTERDLLGERDVPADVYWGIHSARALDNFPISDIPISHYPELVGALTMVKEAATCANRDLGVHAREVSSTTARGSRLSATGSGSRPCSASTACSVVEPAPMSRSRPRTAGD